MAFARLGCASLSLATKLGEGPEASSSVVLPAGMWAHWSGRGLTLMAARAASACPAVWSSLGAGGLSLHCREFRGFRSTDLLLANPSGGRPGHPRERGLGIRRPRRPSPWENTARQGKVLSLGRERFTFHLHVAFSALGLRTKEKRQGAGPRGGGSRQQGRLLPGGPEAPRPEAAVWPGATRGHGFRLGSHVGAPWAPRSSYPHCSWRSSVSQRSGGSWCRGPPGLRVFSCPGSQRPDPPRSSVSCPSTSIKQLGSFEVVTSR